MSLGSLDDPDRVLPVTQHGLEGRRAIFDRLATLPAERTEDSVPAALMPRLASRQHPDHDTETWPPKA